MTETATRTETRAIVVEEEFPHAPEILWKALTTGALMARWLMEPTGFVPVAGTRFTYRTTPAGKWDGTIQCEVLTAIPNERLSYSWVSGDDANVDYGARLETVATFDLTPTPRGTRLRLTHSGFVLPRNELAFTKMGEGWQGVVKKVGVIASELD